jgi:fluoride exporter
MLLKLLLIGLGGAVGSILRYLLAGWVQGPRVLTADVRPAFPLGTLAVNVTGSLVIGVLAAVFLTGTTALRPETRVLVFVGLLGGFTTFSTFSYETLELVNHGRLGAAGANVLLTNAACLFAAWVGYAAIKMLADI